MLFRSDSSPTKSRRLASLENSWNNNIQLNNQPRRHAQMTKDIKKFILQSIDGEVHKSLRESISKPKHNENTDIFGKISNTFNFDHHEGTDARAEMKVVKIILIREGQVMTLQHISDKSTESDSIASSCTRVLELLAEIRESTLNYLEALCLWRQTIPNSNTMSPRVFFWEKRNYTLKIVNDLDFLVDNQLIIEALKLSPEQFRSNPLMLTNNLDDPNTWMDPMERASQDAGGMTQGPVFESRLRLRFAERILLQEIELSSNPPGGDSETFLTEPQSQQPQGYGQYATKYQPHYQQQQHGGGKVVPQQQQLHTPIKGASALESDFEDEDSYMREVEGLSRNGVHDKSTWGPSPSTLPLQHQPRCDSGDSESAVRPSLPNSRSSSINNMSAPSSSQSQHRSLYNKPNNNTSNLNKNPEYGHDFFSSGNWAESKPFIGTFDASLEESSKASTARTANTTDIGIRGDTGNVGEHSGYEGNTQQQLQFLPSHRKAPELDAIDDASVTSQASAHSLDSVASAEVHVLVNVRHPPRNLILAATACVILLTPGPEIPVDVSWTAFLKMCNKIDVAAMLRTLNPLKVHKFKVLAIKPILEQLQDDFSYEGILSNELPFHEYTAVNKLVTWLQQFTASSILQQSQRKVHCILSPSPASAKRNHRTAASTTAGRSSTQAMTGSTNPANELNLGALPKHKRVIPSASLQLAPFYSEVDNTLYKQPILLALLSAYDHKGTGKTKRKPRPPRSSKQPFIEEEEVKDFDRLVVKVYDVTGSAEFHVTVIIREYALLLADLDEAYHNRAHLYFQPEQPAWWATHIKTILQIEAKAGDKMKLKISKKAIEQIVADGLEYDTVPTPLVKLKDLNETSTSPLPSAATTITTTVGGNSPQKTSKPNSSKPPLRKKVVTESGAVHSKPALKAANSNSNSMQTKPKSSKTTTDATKLTATSKESGKVTSKESGKTSAVLQRTASPANGRNSSSSNNKRIGSATGSKRVNPLTSKNASEKKETTVPTATSASAAATRSSKTQPAEVDTSPLSTKATAMPVPEPSNASAAADLAPPAEEYGDDFEAPGITTAVTDSSPAQVTADLDRISITGKIDASSTSKEAAADEYEEDFENDRNSVSGKKTAAAEYDDDFEEDRNSISGKKTAAAEYDEDFEEDGSAGGVTAAGTLGETINTNNAVHSLDEGEGYGDGDTNTATEEYDDEENLTAGKGYYSDFEENSVEVKPVTTKSPSSKQPPHQQSQPLLVVPTKPTTTTNNNNIIDEDRPLSAIEQAQLEFDEIGEDDGVFFNSVDYDEDF